MLATTTKGILSLPWQLLVIAALPIALTTDWQYIGAMVEAKKIGALIKSLDLSQTPEQVGYEFLKRLPEASALSEL